MGVSYRYTDNTGKYSKNVQNVMGIAIDDIGNDIRNTASAAAPHLSGELDRKVHKETRVSSSIISTTVSSEAYNKGYNYALHMHNGDYKLGVKSMAKAGGQSGISGITVPVGKGYLIKPAVEGETAYQKYISNKLKSAKV